MRTVVVRGRDRDGRVVTYGRLTRDPETGVVSPDRAHPQLRWVMQHALFVGIGRPLLEPGDPGWFDALPRLSGSMLWCEPEVEKQGPPATRDAPRRPRRPGDPEDAPSASGTLLEKDEAQARGLQIVETLGALAGAVVKIAESLAAPVSGPAVAPPAARPRRVRRTVTRDAEGRIESVLEEDA